VEQHQREQAEDLGLVGHQLREDPGESDGLAAQLPADQRVAGRGGVALVEHQVQHGQHRLEPFRKDIAGRHPVGDPGVPDLAFRPDQALGHGRLGYQEGPGDLRGPEAAQGAQRQRHLGLRRQGRVAAGEDQSQAIVRDGG
jgi:hypothetical protein